MTQAIQSESQKFVGAKEKEAYFFPLDMKLR